MNEQLTIDDLARHVFRKSAKLGPQLFVGSAGLLRSGHGLVYHGMMGVWRPKRQDRAAQGLGAPPGNPHDFRVAQQLDSPK